MCEPLEGRSLLTGLAPVLVNPQPLPPHQVGDCHPPQPCDRGTDILIGL
jgi:hypothetical protein